MKDTTAPNVLILICVLQLMACRAHSDNQPPPDINNIPEPVYHIWEELMLERHNSTRAEVLNDMFHRFWPGGTKPEPLPPMTWSQELADQAASWVDTCSSHSDPPPQPPPGIGSTYAIRSGSGFRAIDNPWPAAYTTEAELQKTATTMFKGQAQLTGEGAEEVKREEILTMLRERLDYEINDIARQLAGIAGDKPGDKNCHHPARNLKRDKQYCRVMRQLITRSATEVGCTIRRCLSKPYVEQGETRYAIVRFPMACYYNVASDPTQAPY